jgi:RNA polymerase sigma factor (sigma-70 family)
MSNVQAATGIQDLGRRGLCDQELLARFLGHRDQTAFTTLVQRYGSTVWGVCRRMLPQEQDAEDAFQAVFLILARKAAAIRKGEALGSWLYGVAYRTALKARRTEARRRKREQKSAAAAPAQPPWSEAACRELQRLLDEEVLRLPAKFRAPFVLCCLEGLTKAEAAGELGWKEGTVSGRVAQARQLLQRRLARRGVTLAAILTAAELTRTSAAAAAPPVLVQAAAQAGLAPAAGAAPAAGLSPSALTLADAVLRGTVWMPWLTGLAGLLGLILALAAAALAPSRRNTDPPKEIADPPKKMTVDAKAVPVAPRRPAAGVGPARDEQVAALAFSPDGRRLVTSGARAGLPGYLRIWDVATARVVAAQEGIPGTPAVAFSPDGRTLASGEVGGEIRLRGPDIFILPLRPPPEEKEVGGKIRLRDPDTGREQTVLRGHPLGVKALAFSSDGALLASAGQDQVVKLWDLPAGRERQELRGHTDRVLAVAFFHHDRTLVSGAADQTARVWDVPGGKERLTLRGHEDAVTTVAVSPDDRLVATAGRDRTIRLWDAATGEERALLQGSPAPVAAVAFSPDGRFLAGAAGNRIRLWEVATQRLVAGLERQAAAIPNLAFSPGGNYLANGGALGLTLLALRFTDTGQPASGTESWPEYFQSFQGSKEGPEGWTLAGEEAEEYVHFEPEGLRITLPAGRPEQHSGIGAAMFGAVRGDFEITASFEILQEPQPADAGGQTRVSLGVLLDRPVPWKNMATVTRRAAAGGTGFAAWRILVEEPDGQAKSRFHVIATTARTGRLRMKRTGSVVSYSAAGPEGEFTLIRQFPFAKDDVKQINLVAATGGPQAALDVRLKDLRLRAESLSDMPPTQTASPPAAGAGGGGREWLLAAGLFLLAVATPLGVWYSLRHLRRAGGNAGHLTPAAKPAGSEGAAVAFACPGCDRRLKARAALGGKKVRCPQCGKPVPVPGGPAGG